MLIDLEELAGNIASKVNGARLTPVIEKEIVHYEIIRSLGRNDLLRDITFQGGTSLRLCYGSLRYSEDLDFVAGDKFDSLPLDDFSKTLRSDLLKSYDTEVSVREPKVVNDFDGVGMRRWTVSVNTNIARPDLPKQRIKLEIASVPAHTSTIRRVAVNYPELDGMYDNLTIRCQTLEEILADKLISFSATDRYAYQASRPLGYPLDRPCAGDRLLCRSRACSGEARRLPLPRLPCQHDRRRHATRSRLLCRRVIYRTDAAFPIPCRLEPHARFR